MEKQSIGRSRGRLTKKIHLCSTSERFALVFHLSSGNKNDAPEGRRLIRSIYSKTGQAMIIDRAYEDNTTRAMINDRGSRIQLYNAAEDNPKAAMGI